MNKCHTPIEFVDHTTPAISARNLNYEDACIEELDNRVVALANDPPENALKAEGYANGTQRGVPVVQGSPYYHNNAKYWKEQAQAIAAQTLEGLENVNVSNPQNGQVLSYRDGEWVNDNNSIDVSGKADKVQEATDGNFAGLDSAGNLTDSGKAPSDFAQVNGFVFKTKILANANSVQTLSDKQVRNIYAGTEDLTAGSSALATGDIYIVYE